MEYRFEWDPNKAAANKAKHGVDFGHAAAVFLDPLALSIYDEEHSVDEDRWVTLGLSSTRGVLVVHHTFIQGQEKTVIIRIISCRKATKQEQQQYRARQ